MMQFPGVWAAVAGVVQSVMGYWGINFGWTPLVRFIRDDLKWTATEIGLGTTAGRITGILGSPAGGWVVDHWGPRWGSLLFLSAYNVMVISFGWMTELWHYLVLFAIAYFFYAGGMYQMSWPAVNRWWMDRRALMISVVVLGGGFSGIWGGPLLTWMCDTYGWRTADMQMGVAMLISCAVVAFLYPDHMPERYGLYVDNLSPEERQARAERAAARRGQRAVVRPFLADLTTGQALRSFAFWMFTLAGIAAAFGAAPVLYFQNLRMGAAGYSTMEAAAYFSLRMVFSYVGRFAAMLFGDWFIARYPVRFMLAFANILQVIGLVFFALGTEAHYFILWAVFEGTGFGLFVPAIAIMGGAYFGRASFGFIYGLRTGLTGIGGAIAPTFTGWLADIGRGDWTLAFVAVVVGYALAALFAILAIPPKEQVRERRG